MFQDGQAREADEKQIAELVKRVVELMKTRVTMPNKLEIRVERVLGAPSDPVQTFQDHLQTLEFEELGEQTKLTQTMRFD
jgi:hypothetical protein